MKGSIRQRSPGSWELTIDLGRGTRGEAGAGCGSKCGNGAGDAPYPATGSTPAPGLELLTRSRFHQIRGSSLLTVRNGNSILS